MRLRYTLNNDIEGEFITQYSPKGWEETELVLKRHEKYEGIFKDYTNKADFFCGSGKEYLDNIYDTQGIEAVVTIRIEMDCDDSGDYELMYDGQAIMKSYEKIQASPEYTRVNLEQVGIVQTVLNRLETKIDITKTETLDGDPVTTLDFAPYTLNLHSKEIVQVAKVEMLADQYSESVSIPTTLDTIFFTMSFDSIPYEEFNVIQIPTPPLLSSDDGTPNVGSIYNNDTSDSTIVDFNYNFQGFISEFLNAPRSYNLAIVYKIANSTDPTIPGAIFINDYGSKSLLANQTMVQAVNLSGTLNLTVPAGYSVYFYAVLANWNGGAGTNPALAWTMDTMEVDMRIVSTTDASTGSAFAVFETGADIARKITNQADSFRSNFFGRTNSQPYAYNENGCGAFNAFMNGHLIRGFPVLERPLTMSMKEYFDGLNGIYCLGLGVKQEGDNTYIEVEPKNYFYDSTEVVLTLNNVRGLRTILDQNAFYARFTNGYSKWRKEGENGLDEFCTIRNYATLLKSVNNELDAKCEFIAAPYAIERQRRQQYSDTITTDEEYDNDNFIIALNRTVDESNIPTDLDVAEKDENFTDVENVLGSSTLYNLRLSPSRIARNWYKILSTSAIKLNSTLKNVKFTFGEGNKTMQSKGNDICDSAQQVLITENEDLVLEVPAGSNDLEPIFTGEIDIIERYPLSFSNYLMLKELDDEGKPNFYKMIRYSTSEDDYLMGFLDELRYNPIKGIASFRFKRAYVQEIACSHIYVEEGYVECGYVE